MLAQHINPSANHLIAPDYVISRAETAGPVASSSARPVAKSEPYSSATGAPSSYARVHGSVSTAPAVWRSISTVQKEELQDVKYEKADGEGIAKVGGACLCTNYRGSAWNSTCDTAILSSMRLMACCHSP